MAATEGRSERVVRVLVLEDWEPDALLMERALARDGLRVETILVDDKARFEELLEDETLDAILADYWLRGFTAMDALEIARAKRPDLPFIVVTGSINEETAVECMKAGAWDYVVKEHLLRLGPALRAALERRASMLERARAQEELARSQRRFRSLIEHGTDIIVVLDGEGKVVYASPSVEKVLGYSCEEVLCRPVRQFVAPEHLEKLDRNLKRVISDLGSVSRGEYWFLDREGQRKLLEVIVQNLLGDEDVQGVVVNARDVTERRLLEERILRAQKMEALGQLAGGVAHDFNNLLTAILGNVEMLLLHLRPGTEEHQLALAVKQAAEAGARVTRQLTTFAKGQVARPQVVDLRDVVQRVVATLRPLLDKDVHIEVVLDEEPAVVKVDEGQFEQALVNLAVNAREAMPEGGRLVFSVRRVRREGEEDEVVVEVSDSGRGIPEEVQQQVFEAFFTTKENGTGLGLYVVRSITEGHGGKVELESQPGRGTTVRLRFPALDASERVVQTREERHQVFDLPGGEETILVVEDEQSVLSFTIRALTRLGYNVVWARDAEEAWNKVELGGHEIDLVLTDVVLPGMSCDELARRLLELNPGARVIYMSGYTKEHLGRQLRRLEEAEFIQKPFTMAQLALQVRRVLDRPRA